MMNPWLETLGVILLALGGVWAGRWFSRLPKPWWTIGYFVPLALILTYCISSRFPAAAFTSPISWLVMGRHSSAIYGVIGAMILTTPLSRLPLKRDRIAVTFIMIWVVAQTAVWPFLAPAFNHDYLARLKTTVDGDGVCHQSNDYTCGPAAAVTALRRMGLPAEEGELAILARTTSATGTPPDLLARVLQQKYGADGLQCEYRLFNNLAELKAAGSTLVIVKFNTMVDHYLAVLEVTDTQVIVGDPLTGKESLSHAEFLGKWRRSGIVLKRGNTPTSQEQKGHT